jgi:signal transduction histidine kinase
LEKPSQRPLVLVVEDDPRMSTLICRCLEGAYRTYPAFDGKEGLAKALALRPDLILSDMQMPLGNGDDLVRAVRQKPELDSTPIVFLTSDADQDLRARMLREGAQDYVTKPFAANELLARVANLVSAKRARDVLQQALDSHAPGLEALARELAAQKRELATALDSARVARDLAERASQLKSNFLSLVSHELRTPIASVLLQIQTLLRFPDLPRQEERKSLGRMGATAKRLADLIESLLDYAGIASGRLEVKVEWLDLQILAMEVVEDRRPQAEQKGLELRLTSTPELPLLQSDARLLRLILNNLTGNAIKFTEQGAVEVSLSFENEFHSLSVKDTGPGISRQDRRRIFEPFEHLAPINHKHLPGVGLGLALVRELTAALGGEITLESEPGRGSTFEVTLSTRAVRGREASLALDSLMQLDSSAACGPGDLGM